MLSRLRNLGKAGGLARSALSSNQYASAGIASSAVVQDKIVAVLYKAGEASQEKRLLGCLENELGLRSWLEEKGHTYVVTDDKEGPDCELEKLLPDADVIITTPFHPGYLTPERMAKAKNLKLALTAGIGSDHVDLPAAAKNGVTVAEVTGSNVVSVAEHVVMMMLALVRNYMTAHYQVIDGKWDVAQIAKDAFDLENKVIGTIGAGRIGQRVLERLVPFKPAKLLYSDYAQLPKSREQELQAEYVSMEELVKQCDVITINCPLHKETEGMFNKRLFDMMKPKSFLVNTARGAIVNREDLVAALESGQLQGYAGDVWYPQPAPQDHPWRKAPRQAMTPHYSGTTLDAQKRYAAGTKEILRRYFEGEELNPTDVIVSGGKMAAQYDGSVEAKGRSLEFKEEWEKIGKPSGPASGAKS